MNTQDIPPAPNLYVNKAGKGYPTDGEVIGPAWKWCWERLYQTKAETWTDGQELAAEAAEKFEIKDISIKQLLTRMATAEHLERKHFSVPTGRGNRNRTFYRIKRDGMS